MAWVKIDDQFSDHPKVIEVGPLAECLFVRGLTYASRYLTDGFVPASHLRRMGDLNAIEEAGKLVASGLWHEADGGYLIHDYLDYNPSAEKVKADREAARERMGKARSGKSPANNHPRSQELPAKFARTSDNPVPSRPQPELPNGSLPPPTPQGGNAPTKPDDVPDEPKTKTTSRKKPSGPIPADFTPTPERIGFAVKEGLSEPEARHEFRKMQTHAMATDRRQVDWEQTWRAWVLKEIGDRQKRNGSLTVMNGGNTRPAPGKRGFTGDELLAMSRQHPDDDTDSIFGDVIETKGRIAR